jgi:hypothetical protein
MRKALTAKSAKEDAKLANRSAPQHAQHLLVAFTVELFGGELFFKPGPPVSSLFLEATCAVYRTNES